VHGEDFVNTLNRITRFGRRIDLKYNMNATDNQHSVLDLDLACGFCGERIVACINLARFQRAAKCAYQSTGCRGDNIIKSGSVWFDSIGANTIVLRDWSMGAEAHRL
jgi:hypothetical protein